MQDSSAVISVWRETRNAMPETTRTTSVVHLIVSLKKMLNAGMCVRMTMDCKITG